MEIILTHDAEHDVWTIGHVDVQLRSAKSVSEWRRIVLSKLEAHVSDKVDLLIDLHGFEIEPSFADAYGRVSHEIRRRFARSVIRYGPEGKFTSASIRLQSIRNGQASMIFASRDEALTALRTIRQHAS
ncbi:MAG TPA: hypothetical protein VI197_07170 [Polyangiaceae bacterium]